MSDLALETIALLREYISSGSVDHDRLSNLHKSLAFALDESKVYNRPTDVLESLYESVLWLRCDVLRT